MSEERYDHAAHARRALNGLGPDTMLARASVVAQGAQVHATLALVEAQRDANAIAERAVEQQRIANVIALIGDDDIEDVEQTLADLGVDPSTVKADIVAAMGWGR